ncbi:hypothetical protein GCM10009858_00620 [Terrabacter carboxydivorans]|uniref:Uncharacterized protein n=1 Tax=Terrabacter carboxydivorans TaxID=619730 RepID=A0ABN3KR48_9MICO
MPTDPATSTVVPLPRSVADGKGAGAEIVARRTVRPDSPGARCFGDSLGPVALAPSARPDRVPAVPTAPESTMVSARRRARRLSLAADLRRSAGSFGTTPLQESSRAAFGEGYACDTCGPNARPPCTTRFRGVGRSAHFHRTFAPSSRHAFSVLPVGPSGW